MMGRMIQKMANDEAKSFKLWRGTKALAAAALALSLFTSAAFTNPAAASGSLQQTTNAASLYASGTTHSATSYEEITDIVFNVMSNNYGEHVTIRYRGDTAGIDKKLQQVFKDVGAKDDYMRFVLKKMTWNWTSTAFEATIDFRMTYWETPEQSEAVREEVQKAVADKSIASKRNREQLLAMYEWVMGRLRYDRTLANHSAYAGLFGTEGTVCQGYALLLHRMLEETGYESRLVYGKAKGDLHIWNMVKLNGTWHHLDATLDDPAYGRSKLAYFMKPESVMLKDHTWDLAAYPRTEATTKSSK
ncbi:hypothetical protein M3223_06180 [Paenibacillus pasadenensis]|uniref:transglutaminase domain-containing protein n=1 Tax=Paenibacillus pasadenensis TaxID=217090 RepID=UPI00203F24D4|nr:transglutaminase domain-containing protein [Paenibacillus pasadenensis]MCM3746941.1 hypothetical protein [Paenibacillus pasadenensis]